MNWAVHEFLTAPYNPLKALTKRGRLEHHRELTVRLDLEVERAASKLDLKLLPVGDDATLAPYHGAIVGRCYTKVPGFEPKGLVLDVGSQYGDYTLLCAKAGATVHAFEPLPANVKILQRNIELNGLADRIQVHGNAVGDSWSLVRLRHDENMTRRDGEAETLVQMVSIDDLELSPQIIKIDVEGMERDVIEGATRTIKRSSPLLIVETHTRALREWCDGFLSVLGYACLHVDPIPKTRAERWMDEQTNRFYMGGAG